MFTNYKYVHTLSRLGSFTKAAEALYISQPALSVAIRNTEKKVGAQLFERNGRGVRLTPAGRDYVEAAERILQMEQELAVKIHDLNGLESGSVTVGGSNYLSSYVLPKIINVYSARHPRVEVVLTEANSGHLAQLLEREQVDLVVDNLADNESWESHRLAREKILLCVPKDRAVNRELLSRQIRPEDIFHNRVDWSQVAEAPLAAFAGEPFVLLKPGNDMHDRAMGLFGQAQIRPEVRFYVDQLNIAYALAESGVGATFLTDTFFRHARFREDVVLYDVSRDCYRTLCIAHKRRRYCSRAMEEFIRVAKEVIR